MARLLIKAWERSGHPVELASRLRSYDKGDTSRQERLKAIGEKLAVRLIRQYRSRPADNRPGLWFTYHLYHKAPDWIGPRVAEALGIPYVIAEASYAPKQAGGPWDMGHQATAAALSKAYRVIGFNPVDGECLQPLLDDAGKQQMLPPFIDTGPYHQAMGQRRANRKRLSERYRLETDEPWLLCVAMMRRDQKLLSYQLLGESLQRVMDRPWRLLVAGSGPASEDVKDTLATLGDRVTWLGGQSADDLIPIYSASDIFVWPAIKEAYGMVFLEAMSAGLPVVAGRSAGVEGIVSSGINGILTSLGDGDAFASGVARLLDNASLRSQMARAASREIREHHDLAQMSAALGNLANDLMAGVVS